MFVKDVAVVEIDVGRETFLKELGISNALPRLVPKAIPVKIEGATVIVAPDSE